MWMCNLPLLNREAYSMQVVSAKRDVNYLMTVLKMKLTDGFSVC
jgi:hypothetical protein